MGMRVLTLLMLLSCQSPPQQPRAEYSVRVRVEEGKVFVENQGPAQSEPEIRAALSQAITGRKAAHGRVDVTVTTAAREATIARTLRAAKSLGFADYAVKMEE